MRTVVSLLLAVFLSVGAYAAPGDDDLVYNARDVSNDQVARADQAERFVVKVINQWSNVFQPDLHQAHGTGFIVAVTKDRGIVFTNNHVVDRDPLDAQRIVLQFHTDQGLPESIEAKVIYRSPLLDFAAIEFDLTKLRRAKPVVAMLAGPNEFEEIAKKGTQVMAFGHPLDTSNVSTFGVISGFHKDRNRGVYIQTTAPINPGNSGGPLLDMVTGKVVGINTAKITGADNTGYSIPIISAIAAFNGWQRDRSLSHNRAFMARIMYYTAQALKLEGLEELIEKEAPDFFDYHEGMMMITEAAPNTGLRAGDLLLKVNGQVIGFDGYILDQLVLQSSGSVEVVIIRQKQLVKLTVPIANLTLPELRRQVDFVMLSGLLMQEETPDREWALSNNESRVTVTQIVPMTPAHEIGSIKPGAVIVELQIGDNVFPIKRLADVKKALKTLKPNEPVRIGFLSPIVIPTGEHSARIPADGQFGGSLLLRQRHMTLLPVDRVITPRELNLRELKAKFDFTGKQVRQRDWRNFVRQASCSHDVADLGDESAS